MWICKTESHYPPPSPLSLSLSRSHHPIYFPPRASISHISRLWRSSLPGCALLNQTAISECNSTSKPANTLRSRGAHTEGCFIAWRAVTRAWLPISLFLSDVRSKLSSINKCSIDKERMFEKGVHMSTKNYSEKHLLLHKPACTYDHYLIQKETCCVWKGQSFWENFCLKTPSSHRTLISLLGTLSHNKNHIT